MSLFKTLPPWPLDAPTLEELRALPVEPGTWIGIRSSHHGSRGRPFFDTCAWVDLEQQVVRAACAVPVDQEPQALVGLLVEAMRNPDLEAVPARPGTVACDLQQEGVQALAESLECSCVHDDYAFEGSEVLERDLVEAVGGCHGVTYLEREKLNPALVKKLFESAARCWTEGLWRTHAPDTLIRIEGLGKSPVHACVIPRGLVICGSNKALKSYFRGSRERALLHNRYLVLRMVRAHAAGGALFAEIHRAKWPVAAPDAIPVLNLSDRDTDQLASESEMERGVDVLAAVLASLQGKVGEELKVPSGAKVRVSLPSAPEVPRPPAVGADDAVELKVALEGTQVWRKILVPACITLADLHRLLQTVMGWGNQHLYQFQVGRDAFGSSSDDYDAAGVDLAALELCPGDRFHYVYDFGDCWEHDIVVQAVLPEGAATLGFPQVLAGAGACPPEDCGGPDQYSWLLEARASTDREDRAEVKRCLGPGFQPDEFDVEALNRRLSESWKVLRVDEEEAKE